MILRPVVFGFEESAAGFRPVVTDRFPPVFFPPEILSETDLPAAAPRSPDRLPTAFRGARVFAGAAFFFPLR